MLGQPIGSHWFFSVIDKSATGLPRITWKLSGKRRLGAVPTY